MTSRDPNRHHRHLVELASLLATAGLADAFADVFGLKEHGSTALIGLGIALIVGTVGHHIWLRRTDHGPPTEATAPSDAAATGVYWRVRAEIDDTPGRLAVIAGALTAAGANIHALEVHPAPNGVIDQFLIEVPEDTSAERICAAVNAVGGRHTHAVPTDVLALLDAPTRALELAARLIRDPGAFTTVFADLLDAGSLTVAPGEPGSPDARIDGTTLTLRHADGTTYTATRPAMPFTATELSRARMLLELREASASSIMPAL